MGGPHRPDPSIPVTPDDPDVVRHGTKVSVEDLFG